MGIQELSTEEIIELYSSVIKELKSREVIRTNNVVGDLGEYLAINYYNENPKLVNLKEAPVGTENIDAISRKGDRYSIKSTTGTVTGVFYGLEIKDSPFPDEKKFEYVIICEFDQDYKLKTIIEMDWKTFLKHKKWHSRMNAWNLTITNSLRKDSKIVYSVE